jgi:putative hemolysin
MQGTEILYLVLLFVCLLLSAFFCSSETAFFSLQRFRIEYLISTKVKGAKRVARVLERPENFLSTVLLGTNLVNTAAAAVTTALAVSIWGEQGIIIATVVVTILLLIFSETTPKTIANQHPEKLALLYARPIEAIAWLLTPFVVVLSWIASGFSKMLGGQ